MIFRDIGRRDWGWILGSDQRMHLQTMDGGHTGPHLIKIWLEDRGFRAFELARGTLPDQQLKEVRAYVDKNCGYIEQRWVGHIVGSGWLKFERISSLIVATAYPSSPNEYARALDLRLTFPGAYGGDDGWDARPPNIDWDHSTDMLAVGTSSDMDYRDHIEIDFLFQDRDRVKDDDEDS